MIRIFYILLALAAPLYAATTHVSNGDDTTDTPSGARSVQYIHDNLAADGDTITIPAGSYSWDVGVSITKGIVLKGAGGGWMKGYSTTSRTITGSGTVQFTVQAGLGYVENEAITAVQKADHGNYMSGTVQSYSLTTLEIAVTSSGGSGTHDEWNFAQEGSTVLTHDSGNPPSGHTMLSVTGDASLSSRVQDIHFKRGSGATDDKDYMVEINGSGKPVIVENCRFTTHSSGTSVFNYNTPNGVVHHCYFDRGSMSATFTGKAFFMDDVTQSTWEEVAPYGDNDTNGDLMLYIEDCHFHGFITEMMDVNGGMRVVFRYNVVDNSGIGSHGADTGNHGLRWFEVYNNSFVFDDQSDTHLTANVNYFIYIRGGTGIVCNNVIPDMSSSDYGDKGEVKLQIQNLWREGPNSSSEWGADIEGIQYPCPRQVGMGYMDGSGVILYAEDGTTPIGYAGDPEPWYQWGNTGGGNYADPGVEGAEIIHFDEGEDDAADYIQIGRDWKNEAHPSWTAFTHPHPLASEEDDDPPATSTPRYTPRTARGLGISRRR